MPILLHNNIIPTVGRIKRWFVTSGFQTSDELENHVTHNFDTDVLLRRMRLPGKKRMAQKQPDAAFYYIDRAGTSSKRDQFPRLVFEVAFSQSYNSVVEDARQQLVRSVGAVRLVVVVQLEEGVYPNAESGGIQDAEDLENNNDDTGRSSYLSKFSTPEGYQCWRTEWNPDDQVGPLTGFLELCRYNRDSKTAEMDGPRFVIKPLPLFVLADLANSNRTSFLYHQLTSLKIEITDILCRTATDDNRTFTLPLELFREDLDMGKRQLALIRMALYNQNFKKDTHKSEENYMSEGEGAGSGNGS